MRKSTRRIACLLTFVIWWPTCLLSADWPHWRGPHRNGLIDEHSGWTGEKWISPTAKWAQEVGEGSTSPLVVNDRVYMMGWRDQRDYLYCLSAATGEELWSVSYECPRYGRQAIGDQGLYSGPTSTPEYDSATGFLYTLGCDGDLNCWNTNQRGALVWSLNLYDRYQPPRRPRVGRSGRRDYGYTTAPLIHEDWLIVEVGAEAGTLIAFDKTTGEQVWLSAAKGPAGHAGGLAPITVEGIPCVAAFTFNGLLVTRLDGRHAGETVAEYEWITSFANNIATPAVFENYVLITSEYNRNALCKLEITLGGAKKLWQRPLASKVCSPVIHEGHIYWSWRQLHCLDFATGETKWRGGNFSDAGSCLITGDNRLIVYGGRGTLAVVETAERSPNTYQPLAIMNRIYNDDVWPHVVLANGHLYCKSRDGQLKCFKLDGEK